MIFRGNAFQVANIVVFEITMLVVNVHTLWDLPKMVLPNGPVQCGLFVGAIPVDVWIEIPGSRLAGAIRITPVLNPNKLDRFKISARLDRANIHTLTESFPEDSSIIPYNSVNLSPGQSDRLSGSLPYQRLKSGRHIVMIH
jgi:hypothetical protein